MRGRSVGIVIIGLAIIAAIGATIYWWLSNPAAGNRVSNKYPYHNPTSIKFNQAEIDTAWVEWKGTMVTSKNAGDTPRLRVMGGTDMQSSVSEGQGYGMMLASVLDDQPTFDGLWLFTADYLNPHGLMNWHIAADRSVAGSGGATDADEDNGDGSSQRLPEGAAGGVARQRQQVGLLCAGGQDD